MAKKKKTRERRGEESERKRSREERRETLWCQATTREEEMNAVYKVDIGERAWTALTMGCRLGASNVSN